jgi:hypothetical protein
MANEVFLYTDYLVLNGELPFEDHLRYFKNENDFIRLFMGMDTRIDLFLAFELACFYGKRRIAKHAVEYFNFRFNVCDFVSSNHFGEEFSGKDILSFMNCVLQRHKYDTQEKISNYLYMCRYFLSYFYQGLPPPFLRLLEEGDVNTPLKELVEEWQNENFGVEVKEPSVE